MKLPKQPSGVRYLSSTDYTTRITIIQPNNGNALDGTQLPSSTVATVWANVAQWRGKQQDKDQTLQGISSYKVIIRYPRTFSMDSGMMILFNNRQLNIESFADPDGQKTELHIWTWEGDATT